MSIKITFCFHTTDYEFNLGIALLDPAVRNLDVDVETSLVIFRELVGQNKDTIEETVSRILIEQPDIIAFSVMTFSWKKIEHLIKQLRQNFSGLIVVGGCHAMLCPEEVLSAPGVDAVCLGDGEKPLQTLIESYQKFPFNSLPNIPGLLFKGEKKRKKKAWCNEHPENYPYLSYNIFHNEREQPFNRKITGYFSFADIFCLPVITSRGCPYKCTYCNNHSFMNILGGPKKFLRTYPVDKAISGIKSLVKQYNPEFIDFMDEMFLKNIKWMRNFCDNYAQEIGLPYSINIRIDRSTDEAVRLMAESGLRLVLFGLESGDEKYRKRFLNRDMTDDDILRGVELLRKHDIVIVTYNMFGLPLETPAMLEKTFELNRKIQPDAVAAFVYQPLPQTRLAQIAYENNLTQPPPEDLWDYLAPSLDSKDLPAQYVQEKVELFRQEFNPPQRVEAIVSKIRSFVGKARQGDGDR